MSTILNREREGGLTITEAWGVLNFWIFSTNFTLANVLRKVLIFWHSRARYSLKKDVCKRFLHLCNTLPTTIEKNPSLEDQPTFIDQQSLFILSRSSSSSRRNLSGKISHFASSSRWPSYWACCLSQSYRQKSSTAAGQSGHGCQIIN